MMVNILWPFGNVVIIWYIFPRFCILCQEKSGNPASVIFKKTAPKETLSQPAKIRPGHPGHEEQNTSAQKPFFVISGQKRCIRQEPILQFPILKLQRQSCSMYVG
jgi:hypothetical protein